MSDRLHAASGGYVVKYDGGTFSSEIGDNKKRDFFARTLRRFNGQKPWALTLCPLHGRDYGAMLRDKKDTDEFLQAALWINLQRDHGWKSTDGIGAHHALICRRACPPVQKSRA